MNAHSDDSATLTSALTELVEQRVHGLPPCRLVRACVPVEFLPMPLRAALFTIVLTSALLVGAIATGEPRALIGLHLWSGALLTAAMVAYPWLGGHLVTAVREGIAPNLSRDALARILPLGQSHPIFRWQWAIGMLVGALTVALAAPALFLLTHRVTPFAWIAVGLGSALTTNLIYVPGMATVFAFISGEAQALYALDPGQSRLARTLRDLGRRTVAVVAAVSTVGVLAPLALPGLGVVGPVLGALVLSGAVSVTAAQFVFQHVALGSLVHDQRDRTLDELQASIKGLYARVDTLAPEERERLALLLAIHDRVVKAPDRFGSLMELVAFARPLLVPLGGAVWASLRASGLSPEQLLRALHALSGI